MRCGENVVSGVRFFLKQNEFEEFGVLTGVLNFLSFSGVVSFLRGEEEAEEVGEFVEDESAKAGGGVKIMAG